MILKFEYATGATPLDPDEIVGLIPYHIATQHELNEWEASNILKAEDWITKIAKNKNLFTLEFLKQLHEKMFNETWMWAGKFRTTERNIGVSPFKISINLKNLLDDLHHQIKLNSFQIDEIAYRFHHRLVATHPFPNGNGRHARLMTDLLLLHFDLPRFSWGNKQLGDESPVRRQYIDALRSADKLDYKPLAFFVRS